MHVQTTAAGKNASKKKHTNCNYSNSSVCFRVKIVCPKTKNRTVNDDCNFTVTDFKNLFEKLLQDKTQKNSNAGTIGEWPARSVIVCTVTYCRNLNLELSRTHLTTKAIRHRVTYY
jgi:hypothetical protein